MQKGELQEILFTALASPLGIEVETNNPTSLRAKLYEARREDEALHCLSIHPSPANPSKALFIVKKSEENNA
jgi:hypothetical protein